ncbi:MAG: ATP-binding protein [Gemmatimonadota bacterium]
MSEPSTAEAPQDAARSAAPGRWWWGFCVAVGALAAWTLWLSPWWLLLAVGGILAGVARSGPHPAAASVGAVCLVLGVLTGFGGEWHLRHVAEAWQEIREAREGAVADRLNVELDDLLADGDRAVTLAAESAGEVGPGAAQLLAELRRRTGMSALAIYDAAGELRAWDGNHQGMLPVEVRLGLQPYFYGERPLFGYLYFAAPLPGGDGTAVAAALMRADLPPGLETDAVDFAGRFRDRTAETIRITPVHRAAGAGIWDLQWEGEALFSVSLEQPSQAEHVARLRLVWSRGVLLFLALGWLLLAFGARGAPGHPAASSLSLLAAFALLPFGELLGLSTLFSPAEFLLPGPGQLTMGRLLFLGAAAALTSGLLAGRGPAPGLVAAVAFAALFIPGALRLLRAGPATDFLAGPEHEWVAYVMTVVFVLTLGVAFAFHLARGTTESRHRGALVAAAWGVGAVMAATLAVFAREDPHLPLWPALFWLVPFALALPALSGAPGWRRSLLAWGTAALLSVTLTLPYAWADRVDARMSLAEDQVERLGTRVDPYLEFLLHRLGSSLDSLQAAGAAPVELLYGGWVSSGLVWEGYPIWLTLWSAGGVPQEELRIGVSDPRPIVSGDFLDEARAVGVSTVRRFDMADAHYLALVPLPDGAVVTAVVPPRRGLGSPAHLGPLFSPVQTLREPLTLIPLLPGEIPVATDAIRWVPTMNGWQGELTLAYPDEVYHAHYALDVPTGFVLVARAVLLLLLNLLLLVGLWGVGRLLLLGWRGRRREWWGVLTSFRGRVTLALFGFFLVPALVFGTLAYRTLAGASARTAQVLAERAVDEAAESFFELEGSLDVIAGRVGADLLLYEGGELQGGSMRELVELGLYEGWLPPDVHRVMAGREELKAVSHSSMGRWEYVVAYRRVPGGRVLASPAPLQAGATALRRRDVADLLGFAVVLGAALSLGLALLVGRALSQPIQRLQIASERVGAGNLGVRLPKDRTDEFGAVFSAFNRMVLRLRRARRELTRTSRRTQAIVEEAATGVVALDPSGRVTLVNPRAEALLGIDVEIGKLLSEGAGPADELVRWVDLYFRDGLGEAGTELQMGERRIRIRARRISRSGPLGGAVLSLEDVTDELRSERILAWGEMAQQVAHEVKNPLTPIKLGIQHIGRAWEDRRADFDTILTRNVEAILKEIDRLAAIASSFSRFGAPQVAGDLPLEPVRVDVVVREILTLYSAGDGAIEFQCRVPEALPPVQAREAELKEVLVNLLENARAAIPDEGRVVLETELIGAELVLRVTDDGSGIPPHLLPRIFEPHFSTRSTGTGLGLAIVHRLVRSWEGSVSAESREGEGTTVVVRLKTWPERGQPADPETQAGEASKTPAGEGPEIPAGGTSGIEAGGGAEPPGEETGAGGNSWNF